MQHIEFKQQVLFMKDVERIIGRNRLTLRRWWSAGKFPKPIKLNDTVNSWHCEAIEQWINQKVKIEEVATAP
jgi:predicted DNA-binding transcriptional regulator AlpA